MAALQCFAPPSTYGQGVRRLIDTIDTPSIAFLSLRLARGSPSARRFSFGSKNNVGLLLRQCLYPAYASNASSEGSGVTKSSEAAKGPPFLTILAGFLVFLAVIWVIGSILGWLISLIFHVPPSK